MLATVERSGWLRARAAKTALLALLVSVPYFIALVSWRFPACLEKWLFFAPDTREYLEFGQWLTGCGGQCSGSRPYLFPLVLQLLLAAGGPLLFWFYHYVLYVAAGLVMRGVVARTAGSAAAGVALVLYALNFSVAVLTLHALTEITCIFLLSLLVYFLTWPEHDGPLRRPAAFFCLCLLTVVKPVFLYLWVVFLVWLLYRERGQLLRQRRKAALLLGGLAVVGVQVVLMKACFGWFFLSDVGDNTFRSYYYQRLQADVEGITLEYASAGERQRLSAATEHAGKSEMACNIVTHLPQALLTYVDLLRSNIEEPTLVAMADGAPRLLKLMRDMNKLIRGLHLAALLAFALLLVRNRFRLPRPMPGFLLAYLTVLYLLAMSGISFWQGDRLTVFSITVWLSIYPALFLALYKSLAGKIKARPRSEVPAYAVVAQKWVERSEARTTDANAFHGGSPVKP
jgi:hypothetical protein